jgi:Protein of unknown function (DUF3618)
VTTVSDQVSETTTGDDVSRDPDLIQREIEETRAELARTVDLIAERLSPRRAASRGASKVKSGIDGVFHKDNGPDEVQIHVPDGDPGSPQVERGIRTVPLPQSSGPELERQLRKDRVAIALGALAAFTALIVVVRRRKK